MVNDILAIVALLTIGAAISFVAIFAFLKILEVLEND
jgi:hypothetical protein